MPEIARGLQRFQLGDKKLVSRFCLALIAKTPKGRDADCADDTLGGFYALFISHENFAFGSIARQALTPEDKVALATE